LFCFILSCWNFPNQIISYNAIDIFENLTMNRGALTSVESFWSYNAKVIAYWTIFLIKINKIINRNFTQIQRCTMLLESNRWVGFNEIYFIIFILKVWKILNFEWILLLKIQTNYNKLGLKGKWVECVHTWGQQHMLPYVSMKEGSLFCFVIMIFPKPWCLRLCYGSYHQKTLNE
jgi:hypothetical protein